ncbi:hypothetical protein F4604DRAFT_1584223 [Suillus subluteus]|nr:hypothetical protein F4604DRAFT_1584223 [Suillus subluteus]
MRPKCTKEQRTLGKEKTAGMWADIATERENYVNKATELASKYKITCIWMSKQLYMGAKQLVVRRKANAFNKAVKREANRHREQESLGRDGLAIIARDLSATGTWRNEESDEETSSSEEERPTHVKKVTAKTIANEIECTMTRVVDPQVAGLSQRTGCKIWYGITRGDVKDNFNPRTYASPEITDACMNLFKMTPDEMALKIDAYITGGLGAVVHVSGERKTTFYRKNIRDMVTFGLYTLLTSMGHNKTSLPAMAYANYEALVVEWGVELVGWTESQIVNPGDIQSSVHLKSLVTALQSGACCWHQLDEDEWETLKEGDRQQDLAGVKKTRAKRSNAGKPRKN